MFFQIINLLKVILAGLVIALACGPLALWIARRFNLLDIPGLAAHKLHSRPTPLAGGIILALSLIVLLPFFGFWKNTISIVMISGLIVFAFGVWDDSKGLSASQKFIGQFVAAIMLIASDYSVHFLSNIQVPFLDPNGNMILDWVVTIFWFVGITNAFNLIDSMDGLAIGVAAIGFATFMAMSIISRQESIKNSSALLLGICMGIFFYNRPPARLFLGDAGALSLGFILAAIAMIYTPLETVPQTSSWYVPIIVLGYPVFDTTLVVISRVRRRKSIFKADRTHFYHRLIKQGMKPNQAVLVIHLMSFTLSLLGIFSLSLEPAFSNILFGAIVCVGFGFIIYLEKTSKDNGTGSNE